MRPHAASRRELLLASGTLFAWAHLPKIASAEGRDPRFLAIILRGALDGLATVAPIGDPDWLALRSDNALTLDGKTPALKLDEFFALNPAMPNLHRMFESKMPAPRPIASARISTARICWRADCHDQAQARPVGLIVRWPDWRQRDASIRAAANYSRSDR